MRTALSAFLALIVTLGLFVAMASWVDPDKETELRVEWRSMFEQQEFKNDWKAYDILRAYIDTGTSCEVDEDCTIHSFGCPMDCWSVVAKDQVEFIENTMDEVIMNTGLRCSDQCRGPPRGSQAICVAGVCGLAVPQKFTFEPGDL